MSTNPQDLEPIDIGIFDRGVWLLHSWSPLVVLGLILALCTVSGILFKPLLDPVNASGTGGIPNVPANTMLALVPSATCPDTLFFTFAPDGKTSYLYALTVSSGISQTHRITNSSDYSEWLPVPSPVDDRLAYVAISPSGERSIRVIDALNAVSDVTYNTSASALNKQYSIDLSTQPLWSSDGRWIAFLGRRANPKPDTIELFVTEVKASTVYRLTTSGAVIVAFRWSSPNELTYNQFGNDGSLSLYHVSTAGLPAMPKPVLIESLVSRP